MYFCHLFLISSASVRSIPFLSFIVPIFAWNGPLISLIFFLVFPIFLFSSSSVFLCTDHLGRFSYLYFLFFGTLHSNGYIFPFFFAFHFFSFSATCKPSSDSHFAILHFFFFGMVLITTCGTMLWISAYSSSVTLSGLITWIYLSLPLYNHKGFVQVIPKWSSGFWNLQ